MCKRKKSAVCQTQQEVQMLAEKYDAKILCFQYYKKIFGDIVIQIQKGQYIFTFILNRSHIICNCKSFNDGITRTIQSTSHSSHQHNSHIQLLKCIEEILVRYKNEVD